VELHLHPHTSWCGGLSKRRRQLCNTEYDSLIGRFDLLHGIAVLSTADLEHCSLLTDIYLKLPCLTPVENSNLFFSLKGCKHANIFILMRNIFPP